jgi:hypothetical protein
MSTRDRRVTLALKWHHLDNLDIDEIRERFEREGIGSFARSTIRGYLNEQPKEEVLEAIEAEQANVRQQIADREERKHRRAREAEARATEDRPIKRVVPATGQVSTDREYPLSWPDWETIDVDDPDHPEWASERDVIIRFTNETRRIQPGEQYPLQAIDGSPKYTTEFCGLERDQPDQQARSSLRREQSDHLQAKGNVLGVYSTDINMNVDGELDTTVSLDEATAAAIREADLEEGADE